MSIETSNFVVVRDNLPFKCKGSELETLIRSTDELLLQRGDTLYRVKSPVTGAPLITSVIDVNRDFNFGQYLKIINPNTGLELTSSQYCDACYSPSLRDPRRLFNGIDDASNRLQWATLGDAQIYSELIIDFPVDIPVYETIEIKAGFHELAQTGELLINNQVVTTLAAWDRDPQIFRANYNGYIDTFSIRMRDLSPRQDPTYSNNTTGAINFIKVDGIQLLDYGMSTKVTLAEGADMTLYKPFTRVYQKNNPNVSGVIGEVHEPSRTITLFGTSAFEVGAALEVDLVEAPPEILDTDLFACTDVNNITYRVTGAQFKALVDP